MVLCPRCLIAAFDVKLAGKIVYKPSAKKLHQYLKAMVFNNKEISQVWKTKKIENTRRNHGFAQKKYQILAIRLKFPNWPCEWPQRSTKINDYFYQYVFVALSIE